MSDPSQIGEAYVKIRPKVNPAEFEREVEQGAGPAARNAGESLSKDIAQTLTAGAFVAFSATIVRSAAEAEQAVGGTAAVFKDAAGEIDQFAAGSAEAIGLTEQATRQFTSQLGAALKGYGFSVDEAAAKSIELATLGSDLAATFGGTVPDAVTALSAALRGEFDPLERYGVSLTAAAVGARAVQLGLADSVSAVDGQAKALATLSLIQEQSADAQGQFTRELNTAGGQLAVTTAKLGDARDELGSRFLPVVTKGASLVSGLADAFGALPGPVQAAVAGMAGLIALQGPLGRVGAAVSDLRKDMVEGGAAAEGYRTRLATLAKTGTIVAGIAAITSGIEAFKDATADAATAANDALPDVSQVEEYGRAVDRNIARQHELSDELGKFEGAGLAAAPEIGAKAWDFFTSSITGNVSEVGRLKAEYDALSAAIPAQSARYKELADRVNELGERLGVSGSEAADFVARFKGLDVTQVPLDALVKAFNDLRAGADVAQVAKDLGVEVKTAGDEAADAAKKFDELREGLFSLTDAAHAYEDSAQGVIDAERAAEKARFSVVDASRAAVEASRGVVDAQQSYQDALRATEDAERRRVDALESVQDAQEGVIDAQRRLDEALAGPTESDTLDLEAAELRLQQMRERLAQDRDATPTERRLQEIEIRRAEIELAERRAEIDGRAAIAQEDLTAAEERLADAQRSADDAARAVTEARRAEVEATQDIERANYQAQKAAQAVTDAEINAEKASRDVERARYDQLKASEELTTKLGEEATAFAGANEEARKLAEYYRNLIALRPELAAAIAPLLYLLSAASNPNIGAPFDAGSGFVGPQGANPPGVANVGRPFPADSGFTGPMGANGITQINQFGPMDPEEAITVANQRLAQAVGW